MAEQLFWQVVEHLKAQSPGFGRCERRGPAFRFKMSIHVIDSTTLELTARRGIPEERHAEKCMVNHESVN
ncbi:MAG: hypothetical protein KGR98_14170 [Verrucomicrobia bacterium]|nr:hypothetical protein [Verrucomicrobiota bacterium]MDE3098826.1 hypothetical protein [Verrucomicrobiota bacterium]